MTDERAYLAAKRHVEALKGLYVHAIIFSVVMSALVGLNVLLRDGGWWVQWPLGGWGIGLLGHAVAVYRPVSIFGDAWTERKIREQLDRKQPPDA